MRASEFIKVLADYINKHGDLQVAIEDQEFFTYSQHIQFEIARRIDSPVLYKSDERLDETFISIRA